MNKENLFEMARSVEKREVSRLASVPEDRLAQQRVKEIRNVIEILMIDDLLDPADTPECLEELRKRVERLIMDPNTAGRHSLTSYAQEEKRQDQRETVYRLCEGV